MSELFANTSIVMKPPGWDMGFHEHPHSIEISAVLQGEGVFECGGARYAIEAGHVLMIPHGLPHSFRADTAMRFCVLELRYPPLDIMELFCQLTPSSLPARLYLSPLLIEQYKELFRQWLRILSGAETRSRQGVTKAWSEVLLHFLLQYHHVQGVSLSVAKSADYIREQLRGELSVRELALQCGLSETAFRTAFKQMFSMSPKQYQQACRAEEAQWLLRTTDQQIQAISQQVGFETIHAFSAWFQKREGMSPTEWRQIQQQHIR